MPTKHDIQLSLQTPGFDQGERALGEIVRRVRDAESGFGKFTTRISAMESGFRNLMEQALDLGKVFSSTFLFDKFQQPLTDFNKQLYDLSRTSRVVGQSFFQFQKNIDDVSKTTHLSQKEAATFMKTMQDGVRGIRLTAKETADFARTLSTEFGPSLENVTEAMNGLLGIQQKEINVLKRVKEGFKPGELAEYAAVLTTVHGATQKEIELLVRTAQAHGKAGESMGDEEKRLRELADSSQELKKAGDNLLLAWGKPLADMIVSVSNALSDVMKKGQELSKAPWFGTLIKTVAVGGLAMGALGAVGAAAGGVRAIAGGARAVVSPIAGMMRGGAGAAGAAGKTGGFLPNVLGGAPQRVIIAGYEPGALPPGLGPGKTGAAPGMGFGGRLMRGAGGALAGYGIGMAAQAGGEALQEAGHTKAGGAVAGLGTVGSRALIGASIGSVIPVIGTGLGALGGSIWGLVEASDDLKAMFGYEKKSIADSIKERERQTREEKAFFEQHKSDIKDETEFKEGEYESIKAMFGGREFKALTTPEKEQAFTMTKRIGEVETIAGGTRTDPTQFMAKAAMMEMARTLAVKKAEEKGLTGTTKESYIENTVADVFKGALSDISADLTQLIKENGPAMAAAMTETTRKFGAAMQPKGGTGAVAGQMGQLGAGVQAQAYAAISLTLQQIQAYTQQIVGGIQEQVQFQIMYNNNVDAANKLLAESVKAQQTSLSVVDTLVAKLKEIQAGKRAAGDLDKKDLDLLKQHGFSEQQVMDNIVRQQGQEAMINGLLGTRSKILTGIRQTSNEQITTNQQQIATLDAQFAVQEAQYNLVKSMYLGLGPTLDMQFKMIESLEKQKKLYQDQIALAEEKLRLNPEDQQAAQALYKAQLNLTNATQKQLDLTKHLREGYLDAMTAFTNVEGSFGKMILTREAGMGEIMRQFKAPGGARLGALGAGGETPIMKFTQGGGMQFPGMDEMMTRTRRYLGSDADILPMMPSATGTIKDMGPAAEDFFRTKNVGAGGGRGPVGFETRPGAGGADLLTGAADRFFQEARQPQMMGMGTVTAPSGDPIKDGAEAVKQGIWASGLIASADGIKKSVDDTGKKADTDQKKQEQRDKKDSQANQVDSKQKIGEDKKRGEADLRSEAWFKKTIENEEKKLKVVTAQLKLNSMDKFARDRKAAGQDMGLGVGRRGAPPAGWGAGAAKAAAPAGPDAVSRAMARSNLARGLPGFLGDKRIEPGSAEAAALLSEQRGGAPAGGATALVTPAQAEQAKAAAKVTPAQLSALEKAIEVTGEIPAGTPDAVRWKLRIEKNVDTDQELIGKVFKPPALPAAAAPVPAAEPPAAPIPAAAAPAAPSGPETDDGPKRESADTKRAIEAEKRRQEKLSKRFNIPKPVRNLPEGVLSLDPKDETEYQKKLDEWNRLRERHEAGLQKGGQIPGFGGGDKILRRLEPGEFVVNKDAAKENLGTLQAINGMTDGGVAGGEKEDPDVYSSGGVLATMALRGLGKELKELNKRIADQQKKAEELQAKKDMERERRLSSGELAAEIVNETRRESEMEDERQRKVGAAGYGARSDQYLKELQNSMGAFIESNKGVEANTQSISRNSEDTKKIAEDDEKMTKILRKKEEDWNEEERAAYRKYIGLDLGPPGGRRPDGGGPAMPPGGGPNLGAGGAGAGGDGRGVYGGKFNKFGGPLGLMMGSKVWNPLAAFADVSMPGRRGFGEPKDGMSMMDAQNAAAIKANIAQGQGSKTKIEGQLSYGKLAGKEIVGSKAEDAQKSLDAQVNLLKGISDQGKQSNEIEKQAAAAAKKDKVDALPQAALSDESRSITTPIRRAMGGHVPGVGDSDSIPAMLTPGEFVMNKQAARQHTGLLQALNNNKFALGGVVPSPELARGGGGFAPKFNFNIRGDSVNNIMTSVRRSLAGTLNNMMTQTGTTGRYYDLPQSG